MPNRKMPGGEYRDIAHPIHAQARKEVEEAILTKYRECLSNGEFEGDPS